jgi:mannosyltransferase
MIKIIFDNIVFSLQKAGGISVVWYELLKRILTDDRINAYFIEYSSRQNICRRLLNISSDYIFDKFPFLLLFQRYFHPYIKDNKKFIFHSSDYRTVTNRNAINIITVHDFIYEYFSKGLKKKLHLWQKFKAIHNSDFIICVSKNTKNDLIKFLPDVEKKNIRVIYNGVSDNYFQIKNEGNYQLPFIKNSYVLFIGSRAFYKNFELAVRSVSISKYSLVIVGSQLSNKEKIFLNKNMRALRFKYLGYISDKELNILYNNAFSLLYPSAYEGFGIPILEAQKSGCPVIAYKGSSVSEIIGDTSLLLHELSVKQILERFDLLENDQKRMQIIDNGLKNAARFTWDNMYNQIIDVYQEAWCS